MVSVERLSLVICPKQRTLQYFRNNMGFNIRIGKMNQYTRLRITVGYHVPCLFRGRHPLRHRIVSHWHEVEIKTVVLKTDTAPVLSEFMSSFLYRNQFQKLRRTCLSLPAFFAVRLTGQVLLSLFPPAFLRCPPDRLRRAP